MAGLEDLLGSILGGMTQQGAAPAAPGAAPAGGGAPGMPGGFDVANVGNMSAALNKIMMVAGPFIAMFARNGGLQDIMGKLNGAGLGEQANSWVSTGPNQPVSSDQLAAAMPDEIAAIAQQAGLDPSQVSAGLSQLLPGLVNSVTPNGQVPATPDDVSSVLSQIPGGDQLAAMLAPQ
jgi:uncharacterized protein YidB (DUF937 family)